MMVLEFYRIRWWWPWASSFRGACIVGGRNVEEACDRAWELKCNPGGDAYGYPVPDTVKVDPRWRNRLLSKRELDAFYEETSAFEDAEGRG